MTAALTVRGLSVRFGAAEAVRGLDLDLAAGTVTGLIGPNGAGKTSVLDAISGLVPITTGSVRLAGFGIEALPPHRRARLGLARTFQSLELFEDLTVGENLLVAGEGRPHDRRPHDRRPGDRHPGDRLPGDRLPGDRLPGELSHAERSRLAFDRALARGPSVLLLDEPAAGLDTASRDALARRLREVAASGTAVLLVDHDMRLVLEVCDRVTVLDAGRVIAEGPPAAIRADERVIAAYLGRAASSPSSPPPARPGPVGETLLRSAGLTAGYAGVPVVHGVDLTVGAGEVVALLGLNGAGKTTTMLAIAGLLPRMGGDVTVLGEPAAKPHRLARRGLACVRQGQLPFAGLNVAEHLRLARSDGTVLDRLPALRPLLDRPAVLLSGGEQRMLALAMALARRPRLLLVDELSLGLAPQVVEGLLAALSGIAVDDGTGVLIVEQHVYLALEVADRGYVLERGRVTAEGSAADLGATGLLPT